MYRNRNFVASIMDHPLAPKNSKLSFSVNGVRAHPRSGGASRKLASKPRYEGVYLGASSSATPNSTPVTTRTTISSVTTTLTH